MVRGCSNRGRVASLAEESNPGRQAGQLTLDRLLDREVHGEGEAAVSLGDQRPYVLPAAAEDGTTDFDRSLSREEKVRLSRR